MANESSNFDEAFKKFSEWVETNENLLNTACHCCPTQPQQTNPTSNISTENSPNVRTSFNDFRSWKSVIEYHRKLQQEIEEVGYKLNGKLKCFLNEDKTISDDQRDESLSLEGRWHKLWLKSLEQLVVVENSRRCPIHNTTLIGKPTLKTSPNKRLVRSHRIRPLSYPNSNDRLEWDYKYTLSLTGCHKENGSQIDLDSVDEQITKNLTEFGENYELWFGKEDEIANIVHSRPPSVEPVEKPEIAKAVVTSDSNLNGDGNFNLLMLTAPSSILSIDGSKCPHKSRKPCFLWRSLVSIVFVVVLILFSSLYHEPHQMHKSYYNTQPPV